MKEFNLENDRVIRNKTNVSNINHSLWPFGPALIRSLDYSFKIYIFIQAEK